MFVPEASALSVVVPVLNDAAALDSLLGEIDPGRRSGVEVLVVDGGSRDDSAAVAVRHGARLLHSEAGRGRQLGAGAAVAAGPWLWFLHADSASVGAPLDYLLTLAGADRRSERRPGWGRFDVAFEPTDATLRLVAAMMNLRSRLSGICTGDQGIFVHRELLALAGGMPPQPLMEDVELSRRLKRLCPPQSRPETITTSSRRWRQRGVWRTVLGMWWLRLRYWLGADPEQLARDYYR